MPDLHALTEPEYADRAPWERFEKETARAYRAFTIYRDLGASRSQRKVAEQLGISEQLCHRWADRWRWTQRVYAWDDHLDRTRLAAAEHDVEDMNGRHISAALNFQALALEKLRQWAGPAGDFSGLPRVTPSEVLRFLTVGVDLERMARGQVTQRLGLAMESARKGDEFGDLADDPAVQSAADAFLEALAGSQRARRLGDGGESGEVVAG